MATFILSQSIWEFDKLYAIRAMCANMVYVLMYQHARRVLTSHFYVPMCQLMWQHAKGVSIIQLGMPKCQKHAKFSTWHAKMPNGVPIFHFGAPTCQKAYQFFKLSSYKMLKEISILLLYKKFYIILDIIVIHVMCV